MEKSPISLLQEIMIKQCCVPKYELIYLRDGAQSSGFQYKVECNGLTAAGAGLNKKEAKHNAAMEMLKQLKQSDDFKDRHLPNKGALISTVQHSTQSTAHLSVQGPNEFINYVGILNEYCAQKKCNGPVYNVVNATGLSHTPQFTIRCTVSSVYEDATAGTKKQAKQDAARKVFNILTQSTNNTGDALHRYIASLKRSMQDNIEDLGIEILNLKICDSSHDSDSLAEKAKMLYRQLQQVPTGPVNAYSISDRHKIFKNIYSNNPGSEKQRLLNLLYNKSSCNIQTFTMYIQKYFDVSIKQIDFTTVNKESKMVGLRISSEVVPTILQIGIGKSIEEATHEAIKQVINTIIVMVC